ncbi:MAG: hypothetical protein RR975_12655 [Clostridia bacterium]
MKKWLRNGICLALTILLLMGCSSAVAADEHIKIPMTGVTLKNISITDIANDTKAGGVFYTVILVNIFMVDDSSSIPILNLTTGTNFILYNESDNVVYLMNYEESSRTGMLITYELGDTSAELLLLKSDDLTLNELRAGLPKMAEENPDAFSGMYELSEEDLKAGMDALKAGADAFTANFK